MNSSFSLDAVDAIIESLQEALKSNEVTGILKLPLFSGITKGAVTKSQGRNFGGIMQSAECYRLISTLSTRLEEAKIASGLTKVINEYDAGTSWVADASRMLDEINAMNHQSVPVFSSINDEDDAEISFSALTSEQIQTVQSRIARGKEMLSGMESKIADLKANTKVTMCSKEVKDLRALIPGFEHVFQMAA